MLESPCCPSSVDLSQHYRLVDSRHSSCSRPRGCSDHLHHFKSLFGSSGLGGEFACHPNNNRDWLCICCAARHIYLLRQRLPTIPRGTTPAFQ